MLEKYEAHQRYISINDSFSEKRKYKWCTVKTADQNYSDKLLII
jgi:hypothetical protein